jgi:hypothetical protein
MKAAAVVIVRMERGRRICCEYPVNNSAGVSTGQAVCSTGRGKFNLAASS